MTKAEQKFEDWWEEAPYPKGRHGHEEGNACESCSRAAYLAAAEAELARVRRALENSAIVMERYAAKAEVTVGSCRDAFKGMARVLRALAAGEKDGGATKYDTVCDECLRVLTETENKS